MWDRVQWYEVDGGVVCAWFVSVSIVTRETDGRTIACHLARRAYKHPRDRISNPRDLPRTPLIDSHPDIQQLGQGRNDRHDSESSKEGESKIGSDVEDVVGSFLSNVVPLTWCKVQVTRQGLCWGAVPKLPICQVARYLACKVSLTPDITAPPCPHY